MDEIPSLKGSPDHISSKGTVEIEKSVSNSPSAPVGGLGLSNKIQLRVTVSLSSTSGLVVSEISTPSSWLTRGVSPF